MDCVCHLSSPPPSFSNSNSSQINSGDGGEPEKIEGESAPLATARSVPSALVAVKKERHCVRSMPRENAAVADPELNPVLENAVLMPRFASKIRGFYFVQAQNKNRILELQFYILQFLKSTISFRAHGKVKLAGNKKVLACLSNCLHY